MARLTLGDIVGKVVFDPKLSQVDQSSLIKFITGYVNQHLRVIFGSYLTEKWVSNPQLRFEFVYYEGMPPGACTGKSWTTRVQVLSGNHGDKKTLNRIAQVLTVEILHAFMRYHGMDKAEANVENVIAKSNKFVKINIGAGEALQGYSADIYYNKGYFGYKLKME